TISKGQAKGPNALQAKQFPYQTAANHVDWNSNQSRFSGAGFVSTMPSMWLGRLFSGWWQGTSPLARSPDKPGIDFRPKDAPYQRCTLLLVHVTCVTTSDWLGKDNIADALTRPVIAASPQTG